MHEPNHLFAIRSIFQVSFPPARRAGKEKQL